MNHSSTAVIHAQQLEINQKKFPDNYREKWIRQILKTKKCGKSKIYIL